VVELVLSHVMLIAVDFRFRLSTITQDGYNSLNERIEVRSLGRIWSGVMLVIPAHHQIIQPFCYILLPFIHLQTATFCNFRKMSPCCSTAST
jgi:hypothetical protein